MSDKLDLSNALEAPDSPSSRRWNEIKKENKNCLTRSQIFPGGTLIRKVSELGRLSSSLYSYFPSVSQIVRFFLPFPLSCLFASGPSPSPCVYVVNFYAVPFRLQVFRFAELFIDFYWMKRRRRGRTVRDSV